MEPRQRNAKMEIFREKKTYVIFFSVTIFGFSENYLDLDKLSIAKNCVIENYLNLKNFQKISKNLNCILYLIEARYGNSHSGRGIPLFVVKKKYN